MLKALVRTLVIGVAFAWATHSYAEDIVKIGVLSDMSGHSADTAGPGSVVAAELASEDFGNMVGDRKIEIVSADSQNKPDVGLSIATRWYDVENVDVITDVAVSSIALAVQKAATDRHKSTLITGAFSDVFYSKECSPYNIHWAIDTHALAQATVRAVSKTGSKSWYFLTYDFIFGQLLEGTATEVIKEEGGSVVGSVKTPLGGTDYSSFLLQAQASGSQVIGLTQVGADLINAVKQASEFGIVAGGQKLAGFLVFQSEVHSLGLNDAKGLIFSSSFYWDKNDQTRAFAKRFFEKRGVMPTQTHAVTYAAVIHYLNAVKATGSTDASKTTPWMKANKAQFFEQQAAIREDGRVLYTPSIYEVKSPEESKYDWDELKEIGTLTPEQAFKPLDQAKCVFKYD